MFENFGTAIVQAVGFFGVFGYFIYKLISENPSKTKISTNKLKKNSKNDEIISQKKGLFNRNKKNINLETKPEPKKVRWFNR